VADGKHSQNDRVSAGNPRPGGRSAPSFGARLRYRFDNTLSRSPSSVIAWLALVALGLVVLAGIADLLINLTGVSDTPPANFPEAVWQALLRMLDPGTFSDDEGFAYRMLGLLVTLGGIFVGGCLIGLIANAVDQRVESLRKGRSTVLESGHTLILGWSDRVPVIVKELVIANESEKSAAIVILADEDKTTMEDTLRDDVGDLRTTRVVCRSGTATNPADLELVNLAGARSVIAVGGGDAAVVKAVLGVTSSRQAARAPGGAAIPIVAEIGSVATARSIRTLFGGEVVVVSSDAVIAELTAQACRQRGLSAVFRELLDFDGDEIYFAPFESLVGETYGRAQLSFEHCSLMGVFTTDGAVVLNPPAERVIGPGEELIAVAGDDSTFLVTGHRAAARVLDAGASTVAAAGAGPYVVLVGWSRLGPRVVAELDSFLGEGATLHILADADLHDADGIRASLPAGAKSRIEITSRSGSPEDIVAEVLGTHFTEVIVLGDRDSVPTEDADAHTLLTLVAFDQLRRRLGRDGVRIVAELLDPRHAALAKATGADDFIISDELTSLMIAQLSERPDLDQLFQDLFDPDGATIEVVAARRYGAEQATCFADVVAAASAAGQSAIGYRRDRDGTVVVNPPKSEPLRLDAEDGIVVVT